MKVVDWFKSLFSKAKRDYMLKEGNVAGNVQQDKKEFIPKIDVNNTEHKKTREDIIRSLRNDMIIEDLSEEYNYTKFSPENIVILINLMEKSAKNSYEDLGDKKLAFTTVQGLIPGSYGDISQLIEEYIKETEIKGR